MALVDPLSIIEYNHVVVFFSPFSPAFPWSFFCAGYRSLFSPPPRFYRNGGPSGEAAGGLGFFRLCVFALFLSGPPCRLQRRDALFFSVATQGR